MQVHQLLLAVPLRGGPGLAVLCLVPFEDGDAECYEAAGDVHAVAAHVDVPGLVNVLLVGVGLGELAVCLLGGWPDRWIIQGWTYKRGIV